MSAELRQRSALDVTEMTNSNNNWVVWIEVLRIKLMLVWHDLRAARVTISFFNFLKLVLHHLLAKFWIVED